MSEAMKLEFEQGSARLLVGLLWDPNEQGGVVGAPKEHNLDLACAVLGDDLKVRTIISSTDTQRDEYKTEIFHTGDNITGGADFEDESITVNFEHLREDVHAMAFVVSTDGRLKLDQVNAAACEFRDGISLNSFSRVELKVSETYYLAGLVTKSDDGSWNLIKAEGALASLSAVEIENAVREACS
ncbi:MAG: hypothetical protein CMH26_04570 [Micavibrio sp.]|nr:hypothetical protein [Micavibrio sp.]